MSFFPIPDEEIDLTIKEFKAMLYESDGEMPSDEKIIQVLGWFIAEHAAAQIKLWERQDATRLQFER